MVEYHFMFMNKTVHDTILMNIFSNYIPNIYIYIYIYICIYIYTHGSSPPNFRWGHLKISDQNNWVGPEQKIKFGKGD